jgi:hypothetical protein
MVEYKCSDRGSSYRIGIIISSSAIEGLNNCDLTRLPEKLSNTALKMRKRDSVLCLLCHFVSRTVFRPPAGKCQRNYVSHLFHAASCVHAISTGRHVS